MQKLTILAILLSTMVISVAAELVSQDYIQQVRPEIEDQVQSNVLKLGSFTDYIQQQEVIDQAEDAQEIIDNSENNPELDTDEEPSPSAPEVASSVRLESLFPALEVIRSELQFQAIPEKIFASFQISKDLFTKEVYGVIKSDQQTIASIREITTNDEKKSIQVYQELKAIASSFPQFSVNETNEFGDRSFYINPNQDSDSAFLVNQKGNLIYAVGYQKQFHQSFKEWFELLL